MNPYNHIFSEFEKGEIALFYERMYPELLIYASKLLGSEYSFLAEDYVQDAIFKTYLRRGSFKSAIQWKVFLYTCIRNAIISGFRKGNAQKRYLNQVDESEDTLMLDIIEQETITLLHRAVESLPLKYKAIFDLSFEQGLKNAEVAEQLHVAEITVKKNKARLIELLRDELKDKIDGNSLSLLLFLLMQEF